MHSLGERKTHFHEGDKCPSCKQTITAKAVSDLNNELKKQVDGERSSMTAKKAENKKTLSELECDGKALVEEITKAKEEDEKRRKEFEADKAKKVKDITSQIGEIDEKLKDVSKLEAKFNEDKQSEISVIKKQIAELRIQELEKPNQEAQKAFDVEVSKERAQLQTQLSELRKEKQAVVENNARRATVLKRQADNAKEIERKKAELLALDKQEAHIENQITFMKAFNTQKISMLNGTISKHLSDVELKLEKSIASTGEVKDCLDVLYQGKELKICSTSERIKAGLELSNMISELSGLQYPVFVDNGESITRYTETAIQTIETKVVEGKHLTFVKGDNSMEIKFTPAKKKGVSSEIEEVDIAG